jgi:hypothetical protein
MKVTINADGAMHITAESDTEEYTLRKWLADWDEHRVDLKVGSMSASCEANHKKLTERQHPPTRD